MRDWCKRVEGLDPSIFNCVRSRFGSPGPLYRHISMGFSTHTHTHTNTLTNEWLGAWVECRVRPLPFPPSAFCLQNRSWSFWDGLEGLNVGFGRGSWIRKVGAGSMETNPRLPGAGSYRNQS